MNFEKTKEFTKEYKKLLKRYKTLPDDLDTLKKILTKFPGGKGRHFNIITERETFFVIKARLFCRALKGSSLRIIYAYLEDEEVINIEFIELYFKGDKESEDRQRIKKYLKNR